MKKLPYAIILLLLVFASAASGWSKSKNKNDVEADVRKADYFYLEALRSKALGNDDAAFDLLDRAISLNPNDENIKLEYANYKLALSNGNIKEAKLAIFAIGDYYNLHPDDYYTAISYAFLLEKIGYNGTARDVLANLHYRYPDKIDLTFRLADFLTTHGDSMARAEALRMFDTIEEANGLDFAVTTKKMQLHRLNDDTTAVINEAMRLYRSNPAEPEYNIFMGQVYSVFHENDSALSFLNRSIELDPSNGLSYYSLANFYLGQGDTISYNREIRKALSHDNLDFANKMSILQSFVQDAYNPAELDTLLSTMVELHPHESAIHEAYASALVSEKDYVRAADEMQLALDLDPDNENGWRLLASLYFQNEDLDKAQTALEKARHFFPENSQFPVQLGALFSEKKDFDTAERYLDEAEKLADNNVENLSDIYSMKANILIARGDTIAATEQYEKAIKLNPENISAMNNYAYHLACIERELPKALSMIEKVIEAEPDNASWLDTYAWVLFKMKNYDKALEIIDKALAIDDASKSAEVYEHAGDIYFMNARPDEALDFWKTALELSPDSELLQRKVKQKTFFFK
ncbi:MAG: tetratricopeptide repeat protein [Duncaniella sp.]|nr:tetratricopeptide repeat protein [Duncaniella sp.]